MLFEAFSITGQCVKQIRHFTLDPVAPDWPELEADRQRLLEPGEGAISTWNFGPLNDVLEQVDARENRQAFSLTLDGRLRETRLQLQGLTLGKRWSAISSTTPRGKLNGKWRVTLYKRPSNIVLKTGA